MWLGKPREGNEQAFATIICRDLIPAMRCFTGVEQSLFLWSREHEAGSPPIHFQSILEFTDRERLAQLSMLPERAALLPSVLAALGLFDGFISHINYENG